MTRFPRVQLRHLSEIPISNGLGLPGSNDNPEWPRYIRTTDIASPTRLRDDVFASQPPSVASSAMVSRGDLLMTAAGASIGKSVRFTESYPACFAGFLVRLRPHTSDAGRYLGYWMQSRDYWDQIAVGAVKSTIENFSASRYRALTVPLPTAEEQRAIVDHLDQETARIDALVTKQEELIRGLEERRLAVITTTALTGLDHEEAGDHTISRWGSSLAIQPWLHKAPAAWRMERFRAVCRAREERNLTGSELMLSLTVKGNLIDRSSMAIQQNASESSIPRYLVTRPGDLVVNPMWLTGGAIGVSDKRGAVSPDYRVFEVAEVLDPWYLHAVLRSAPYFDQYRLFTRSNTTFDRRIKQNDLDNLALPIPPLDEQHAIVEHINEQTRQIDALIAKAKEHAALAKERRSALITAAVTGQFDVRTARKAG